MKIAEEKIIIENLHRGNNSRENRSKFKTGLIHVYRCIHVKTKKEVRMYKSTQLANKISFKAILWPSYSSLQKYCEFFFLLIWSLYSLCL